MRGVNKREIELKHADLESLLSQVAEKENPGFKVEHIHFDLRDVGGDYPEIVLAAVNITMKEK